MNGAGSTWVENGAGSTCVELRAGRTCVRVPLAQEAPYEPRSLPLRNRVH